MLKFKKGAGWILVIASVFLGLGIVLGENLSLFKKVLPYTGLGLLPAFAGFYLIRGKEKIRVTLRDMKVYTLITLFLPLFAYILIWLPAKWKGVSRTEQDFAFDASSVGWISNVQTILLTGLLICFSYIFLKTFRRIRGYVWGLLVLFLFLYSGTLLSTMDDFRAIRDDGIVQVELGTKEKVSWMEVEEARLIPFIDYPLFTDEEVLSWKFEFDTEEGETYTFDSFFYEDKQVKESLSVKAKVMEEGIPFTIVKMNEDQWNLLEEEDREGTNLRRDYYELIGYDAFYGKYLGDIE
ncbi:hypothetical protein M662_15255 [Bacillus sp. SB49]|uniref:hypothetical protein n=1 Tax=Bacillus sp. SB49 TaxID=1071080 RepID=UPI00041106A3|nr:hypothetical protein [Bacillus sp. SB49]QHT47783.1 hypothetical protein M662_15255 [Bacillus sp. SB49]